MRYVTDEVTENLVSLQREIDCIDDYIDLQRLRLGKKTKLNFNVSGVIGQKKIAPLVLMTFIENVFKYGVSKHEAAEINIAINVSDKQIAFHCQNQIFDNGSAAKSTGIGISNTRQRLEHIYHGKHRLDINTHDNLFIVDLEIDC
jgi:LytS/YehU family sensor histidine kinase